VCRGCLTPGGGGTGRPHATWGGHGVVSSGSTVLRATPRYSTVSPPSYSTLLHGYSTVSPRATPRYSTVTPRSVSRGFLYKPKMAALLHGYSTVTSRATPRYSTVTPRSPPELLHATPRLLHGAISGQICADVACQSWYWRCSNTQIVQHMGSNVNTNTKLGIRCDY
jgi:hypothetical protein